MQQHSLPTTLPRIFEAQVNRTPSATALIFNDLRLTYAELNRQANRLARSLADSGIGRGTIAAVAATRSPQTIVAILAVLKSGAAYLPLDPQYPRERLKFMLDDARPATILATADALSHLDIEWPSMRVDDTGTIAATAYDDTDLSDTKRLEPVHESDPAYIIYTSGSTGRPKGVVVSHKGVPYLVSSQVARFAVTPESRVLQFSPLSFDASISEIAVALSAGACLVMAPKKRLLPGKALAELVDEAAVTHLTLPPSALAAMPSASLASVETLVVAGEPCPPALVAQWSEGRRMINAYGPTETTVCATMSEPLSGAVVPPLGTPIEGSAVYVLDASRRECGADIPGDLYVAGPALALGYLGRPDLTAQRFVTNSFGPPGSRMYQTGDKAVRRTDGSLHFLGRSDNQLKIRGFRVEPGEIEQVLLHHPAVAQAAVVVRATPETDPQLIGYVSLIAGADENAASLRHYLGTQLPHYMIPARTVILDALPVTHHGKVDRAALSISTHGINTGTDETAAFAASTPLEAQLTTLFADVLGVHGVGLQDSFFDMGGHSLSAVRLARKINETFHIELELDEIYESPTVAALAKLMTASGAPSTPPAHPNGRTQRRLDTPHLLLLAGSGVDHVFCVHAADGGVSLFRELARRLAPEATVYGITAIDLERRTHPQPSVHAIAANYVDQVRQVQPSGPYHIVGWSSGGLLAYEMACQLTGQGQQVGSITALDTWRPAPQRPWRRYERDGIQWTADDRNAQWHYFMTKFLPRFHTLEIADPRHVFWPAFHAMDDGDKRDAVLALAYDANPAAPRPTTEEFCHIFDVVLLLERAMAEYQASAYSGTVDLYVTDFETRGPDTAAYWESFRVGAVNSRDLAGDHTAVVEFPGVCQVAKTVLAHLRRTSVTSNTGLPGVQRRLPLL